MCGLSLQTRHNPSGPDARGVHKTKPRSVRDPKHVSFATIPPQVTPPAMEIMTPEFGANDLDIAAMTNIAVAMGRSAMALCRHVMYC